MTIHTLRAGADNLVYLITEGAAAAVVDPGEATPVARTAKARGVHLDLILVTHTHPDHTGGCEPLRASTGCRIAGPPGTPGLDRVLSGGETVAFGGDMIEVIATPGHTRDHLVYHAPRQRAVFTGDTLIAGACGRILGATAAELWNSLKRIRALPPETRVYGGHDYLLENLTFAAELEPGNEAVQDRLRAEQARVRKGALPDALPLVEETRTNPFLRCDDPALADAVGLRGVAPDAVFAELRKRKDVFNF